MDVSVVRRTEMFTMDKRCVDVQLGASMDARPAVLAQKLTYMMIVAVTFIAVVLCAFLLVERMFWRTTVDGLASACGTSAACDSFARGRTEELGTSYFQEGQTAPYKTRQLGLLGPLSNMFDCPDRTFEEAYIKSYNATIIRLRSRDISGD